jgi:hypothetical protein
MPVSTFRAMPLLVLASEPIPKRFIVQIQYRTPIEESTGIFNKMQVCGHKKAPIKGVATH